LIEIPRNADTVDIDLRGEAVEIKEIILKPLSSILG
jgi:hypothetical protein